MLLALETATNVCSIALKDEEGKVHEKRTEERGSHSEKLFLFIEELMEEQQFSIPDLKAVLVSEGPGSYTGLRISASAVKGLLFQSEVPLFAINTLAAFAQAVVGQGIESNGIHAVIDARRVHLYHQQFIVSEGALEAKTEVDILPIEKVEEMITPGDTIIGTGIERIDEKALEEVITLGPEHITARSLISLFESDQSPFLIQVDPESYDPKYYTSRQVSK